MNLANSCVKMTYLFAIQFKKENDSQLRKKE